jgi:predicted MFS family arabinose efflux permease
MRDNAMTAGREGTGEPGGIDTHLEAIMQRVSSRSVRPPVDRPRSERPSPGRSRAPAAPGGSRITTVALHAGTFAVGTGLFLLPGLLGSLASAFDVPMGLAGAAIAGFSLAYGLGGPLLHSLLSVVPPRQILFASIGTFAVAAVVSAAAPTMGVLLAAQVVGGLAASAWGPVAVATAVATAGADRVGRTLGGFHAASSLAMITGAPVGLLLARTTSWRVSFGLVAAIAGIALAALITRPPAALDPASTPAGRGGPATRSVHRWAGPRSPAVRATLTVTLLVMTASGSVFSYLGVLLAGHAGPVGIEACLVLFGVAGVVGTWLGGRAADRYGGRAVALPAAGVLIGVTVTLPALVALAPAVIVAVLAWGLSGWAFLPGQQHRLIVTDPPAATILLALHSSAAQLGMAAGAVVGGLLIDAAGVGWLWVVPAVAGTPAVAGLLAVGRSR